MNSSLFERTSACLLMAAGLGAGCASAPANPAGRVDAAALVRQADAEIDRGCYLCLKSAAEKYEAAISAGARSLDLLAAGAWILLEVRERELGLQPSGALEKARSHAAGPSPSPARSGKPVPAPVAGEDQRETINAYVRIASSVAPLSVGASLRMIAAASEASRSLREGEAGGVDRASREARQSMAARPERPDPPEVALMRRRAREAGDRAAAYLAVSFDCGSVVRPVPPPPSGTDPGIPKKEQPSSGLMTFASTICGTIADRAAFARLLEIEPRFHEAHFFLGRRALVDRKLVTAEREFLAAADGLPAMTGAWALLGSTRLVMEEYDWAAADIARALAIEPDQREALLAQARALNYAGRFEEAMIPAQRLLDLGAWYVSDANYWLAFSELQLGRLREADAHVREAKRTNPMNGDTARLVGLVAHRLAEFDRAQGEFELAISRNSADCESHLHLGMIHGQNERMGMSVDAFLLARDCYAALAESSAARRAEIDASTLSEARKETARGRLARRIQGYRSAQAGAAIGAAEGETARGAYDKALERLADAEVAAAADPTVTARAKDLRTRITALGAASRRKP